MFAFALFDSHDKTLLIVRDRFGIKPLHYCREHGTFRFGSEIKSLFAGGLTDRRLLTSALREFLYFGVALGSRTLYKAVDRLLPGHAMLVHTETLELKVWAYYQLPLEAEQFTPDDAEARVPELLDASVRRHLISDVPVAVFLSGGIDSSAITAFATKNSPVRLVSYSVGFDIPGGVDELPVARQVAKYFGTDHRELHINIDKVEFVVEKLADAHDVPFGDAANIPLYLLCEQLRGEVKVVLQGDGGDEFFGGYARYKWLRHATALKSFAALFGILPGDVRARVVGPRAKRVLDAMTEEDAVMMALLLTEETVDSEPERVLSQEWRELACKSDPFERYVEVGRQIDSHDPVQRMLYTDTQIILPDVFLEKVDRSTMAHGIEVRVPFLDSELTDFVLRLRAPAKLPGGTQKGLLRKSLRGILPDEILNRRKTGFSVPYKEWMRGSLGDKLSGLLDEPEVERSGIFDGREVRRRLTEHRNGRGRHGFLLYKLLTLALWMQRAKVTVA
jgi:asparagine synthase (glutamine-hydrolysing)